MSRSIASDVARVAKAVPWQVWVVMGLGFGAAYMLRRAADASESVLSSAAGAAKDLAVGSVKVAVLPLAAAAAAVQVVARPFVESPTGAAVADAGFGFGEQVADAMQSFPGVIDALDTFFGALDKVTGVRP
jgi:hypothetical protein